MLWYVQLDQLPERFNVQMHREVMHVLETRGIEYRCVYACEPVQSGAGDFLNWPGRAKTCALQNAAIADAFANRQVSDGDVFFFSDVWHPGVEAVRYMAGMMGITVRIYAVQYAGAFDPNDAVAKLGEWARLQEAAWYAMLDGVFVGSHWHRKTVLRGLVDMRQAQGMREKIKVTGLVWRGIEDDYHAKTFNPYSRAGGYVLWPHRVCAEKGLGAWNQLCEVLSQWDVEPVACSGRVGQGRPAGLHPACAFITAPKDGYYLLMKGAEMVVSTAHQETWGYTLREAEALGVPYLAPRRACYPEFVPAANLYGTDAELARRVVAHHRGERLVPVLKLENDYRGFIAMLGQMQCV